MASVLCFFFKLASILIIITSVGSRFDVISKSSEVILLQPNSTMNILEPIARPM